MIGLNGFERFTEKNAEKLSKIWNIYEGFI